jgi:type II restriction enzyme
MNLRFDQGPASGYTSRSQVARVLSEQWILTNIYCPACGTMTLEQFKNNNQACDFFCSSCARDFELKSTTSSISSKVVDGAYGPMIRRVQTSSAPNFFFLRYMRDYSVRDLFTIPKAFFTEAIIEKRKPLAESARRAGWIGCNILVNRLPLAARIYIVEEGHILEKKQVLDNWSRVSFLNDESGSSRGWLVELMAIVERLPQAFALESVYRFEGQLKDKFPNNSNIRPKIRQQLQVLRDNGFISFIGNGHYVKK